MTLTAPSPVLTSEQTRWRRMVPPGLLVGGVAAATVALHLRDPHSQGSWGICPTAALGFSCPGCGGLRAVNDLSNFRILDAASSNLLFIVSLPVIAYVLVRWIHGRWTGHLWEPSDRTLKVASVVAIAAMVIFTVLRNTPTGSWLAP